MTHLLLKNVIKQIYKATSAQMFVCLIWFFTSTQQSFSYAGWVSPNVRCWYSLKRLMGQYSLVLRNEKENGMKNIHNTKVSVWVIFTLVNNNMKEAHLMGNQPDCFERIENVLKRMTFISYSEASYYTVLLWVKANFKQHSEYKKIIFEPRH